VSIDLLVGLAIALAILLLLASASIRIVNEYERGVIFRLGRVIAAKGPGLFLIIPIVDRMAKVSLRTVTMDIPHPRTSSPATTSPSGSTPSPTSTSSTRSGR
jgi:regulator of protease activity HflC (stomatin/prohibitin superfamily)